MLKIVQTPTFTHKVKARVPTDGGHRDEEFSATFRVLPASQAENYDYTTGAGMTEFLRAVVVRLDELADEQGKEIPYSDAVRDAVLDLPYARRALADTYIAAVTKAAAGN